MSGAEAKLMNYGICTDSQDSTTYGYHFPMASSLRPSEYRGQGWRIFRASV